MKVGFTRQTKGCSNKGIRWPFCLKLDCGEWTILGTGSVKQNINVDGGTSARKLENYDFIKDAKKITSCADNSESDADEDKVEHESDPWNTFRILYQNFAI